MISGSEDVVNYTNHQINLFQILLDVMNKHIPPCKSIFGLLITLLSEKAYIMNVWYAREKVRWSIDSRLIRLIILLSSSTCIYIRYFMVNKVHSIFDVTTTFWNIIQRRSLWKILISAYFQCLFQVLHNHLKMMVEW